MNETAMHDFENSGLKVKTFIPIQYYDLNRIKLDFLIEERRERCMTTNYLVLFE